MKLETRIRQSEKGARDGARRVLVFVAAALVALGVEVAWLAKLFGVLAALFAVDTAIESWNAWRLRRQAGGETRRAGQRKSQPEMKLNTRIRQSEVRVRSGVRLFTILVAVSLAAFAIGIFWLAKLLGVAAAFFFAVTGLEFWNAWRLKRQRTDEAADPR